MNNSISNGFCGAAVRYGGLLAGFLPVIMLCVCCLLLTVSCRDEEPLILSVTDTPLSAGLFFPDTLPAYYDVEEMTSLQLTLCRTDTSLSLTLPVVVKSDQPVAAPSQLFFAAGVDTAVLRLSIPYERMPYHAEYPVRLTVGRSGTASGLAEYQFVISRQYPWKPIGTAIYREDLLASLYNDVQVVEYEVPIEEHQKHPGYYRLVEPYGAGYRYHEAGRWDASEPRYLEIHAEQSYRVWLPEQATGLLDPDGKGMISVWSPVVEAGGNSRSLYGKLRDGCITFPADALRIATEGNPVWRNANHSGRFRVALPGVQLTYDYNTEYAYTPYYVCSVSSQLRAGTVSRPKTWSNQIWQVNDIENLVYLPDYFSTGYGLAFHLDADEQVSDVHNPQPTGLTDSEGRMKYVQVTQGRVTHGNSFYPLKATLQLHLFSCDESGAMAVDDSLFTEVITASRKVSHVWSDLKGGSQRAYLNMWNTELTSWPDGGSRNRYLTLGDLGVNEAGEPMVGIANLSGMNNVDGFSDMVRAVWRDSAIYVQPQMLSGTYQGDSVALRLLLSSTGQALTKYQMMGCICEDGCLVFMSPYSDLNINGFCFVRKHAADQSETLLSACFNLCGQPRWRLYTASAGPDGLSDVQGPLIYTSKP